MKIIKTKVYPFNELSEEAKKKALDDNRDINTEYHDWYTFTIDEAKSELEEQGFLNADISFSGFWSQGDGASFTADIDFTNPAILALIPDTIKPHAKDLQGEIYRIDRHYSHENTVRATVDVDTDADDATKKQLDAHEKMEDDITKFARELMRKIYGQLQDEYDSLTSDEQIKDMFEANDYHFTADGKLV